MPFKEAKWREFMKEHHKANKDKISADATSYSEEHDIIEIITLVIHN